MPDIFRYIYVLNFLHSCDCNFQGHFNVPLTQIFPSSINHPIHLNCISIDSDYLIRQWCSLANTVSHSFSQYRNGLEFWNEFEDTHWVACVYIISMSYKPSNLPRRLGYQRYLSSSQEKKRDKKNRVSNSPDPKAPTNPSGTRSRSSNPYYRRRPGDDQ